MSTHMNYALAQQDLYNHIQANWIIVNASSSLNYANLYPMIPVEYIVLFYSTVIINVEI